MRSLTPSQSCTYLANSPKSRADKTAGHILARSCVESWLRNNVGFSAAETVASKPIAKSLSYNCTHGACLLPTSFNRRFVEAGNIYRTYSAAYDAEFFFASVINRRYRNPGDDDDDDEVKPNDKNSMTQSLIPPLLSGLQLFRFYPRPRLAAAGPRR